MLLDPLLLEPLLPLPSLCLRSYMVAVKDRDGLVFDAELDQLAATHATASAASRAAARADCWRAPVPNVV